MSAPLSLRVRQFLQTVGSIWFAAVLLVVIILTMACATVYESTHGAERALFRFYQSWWFELFLGLLSINVLAAMAVRYPFTRRQVGFVMTHASILAVLIGSLTTRYLGVSGELGMAEGETVAFFAQPNAVLTLVNRATGATAKVDLQTPLGNGFRAVNSISRTATQLDDVDVAVGRYIPDSEYVQRVEEVTGDAAGHPLGDSSHKHPAVEVSLSESGRDDPQWLFLDRPMQVGSTSALFRRLDQDNLERLLLAEGTEQAVSLGNIRVLFEDRSFEIPVDQCLDNPVPLDNTGMSLRVLRYLPHATVTADGHVVNASPNPMNPAVQLEIKAGEIVQTRIALAQNPELHSVHGGEELPEMDITYVLPDRLVPEAPLELFAAPNGELYARFTWEGTNPITRALTVGEPIDTPWPEKKLAILRRYEHARVVNTLNEVDPIRKKRVPAVFVTLTGPDGTLDVWVRRRDPVQFSAGGKPYELHFGDALVPLSFKITLDDFRVGHYPGGLRPRSFESHVTFNDPRTGLTQSRVVSMNNPVDFGGYTFYQESYARDGDKEVSFMSVARDPGTWIVFLGYIGTMIGMVVVLTIRARERQRSTCEAVEMVEACP
ncbi:MAG: cytochrome c biogenesis protein ResB [Planctomycetota bacterium]|jgi:hypothetical protein